MDRGCLWDAAPTVVVTDAVLLVGVGSLVLPATFAVLVMSPAADGVTTTVTLTDPFNAKLPMLHVTVPAA